VKIPKHISHFTQNRSLTFANLAESSQNLRTVDDLRLQFWPCQVQNVADAGVHHKLLVAAQLAAGKGLGAVNEERSRRLQVPLHNHYQRAVDFEAVALSCWWVGGWVGGLGVWEWV